MDIFYCPKRKMFSITIFPNKISDAIFVFETVVILMVGRKEKTSSSIPFHLSEQLFLASSTKSSVTLRFDFKYFDFAVNFLQDFNNFLPEEARQKVKNFLEELKSSTLK